MKSIKKRPILLITFACLFSFVNGQNIKFEPLKFKTHIFQEASCELNNGIIVINIINGTAPFNVTVDEFNNTIARYSNISEITSKLVFSPKDEYLVNHKYQTSEIIINNLPPGDMNITVTDANRNSETKKIHLNNTMFSTKFIRSKNTTSNYNLSVKYLKPKTKDLFENETLYNVELEILESKGSYSKKEIAKLNAIGSFERYNEVVDTYPSLFDGSRNVFTNIGNFNITYSKNSSKNSLTIFKDLIAGNTYKITVYPAKDMRLQTGVCILYEYVFSIAKEEKYIPINEIVTKMNLEKF